jgi:hypothetical protein
MVTWNGKLADLGLFLQIERINLLQLTLLYID